MQGESWLLWCGMNDEQEMMCRRLREEAISFVSVDGSTSLEQKEERIAAWIAGDVRVLVTKGKVLGHGMNFQHCHNMAFVGLSDSWELYYQCIRRCYRFGQQQPVEAHIILSQAEEPVYANVMGKEAEAQHMAEELISHVRDFEQQELHGVIDDSDYRPGVPMRLPAWLAPCA